MSGAGFCCNRRQLFMHSITAVHSTLAGLLPSCEREGTGSSKMSGPTETNNCSSSYAHLQAISSHQLTCMCLYCDWKPENLEEIHTETGRTCRLHTERSNPSRVSTPRPSCCEGTVPTTEPPCYPVTDVLNINVWLSSSLNIH